MHLNTWSTKISKTKQINFEAKLKKKIQIIQYTCNLKISRLHSSITLKSNYMYMSFSLCYTITRKEVKTVVQCVEEFLHIRSKLSMTRKTKKLHEISIRLPPPIKWFKRLPSYSLRITDWFGPRTSSPTDCYTRSLEFGAHFLRGWNFVAPSPILWKVFLNAEGFSIGCISFHWLPFFVYEKLCKIPFDEVP